MLPVCSVHENADLYHFIYGILEGNWSAKQNGLTASGRPFPSMHNLIGDLASGVSNLSEDDCQ